jgi:hypothetical protein
LLGSETASVYNCSIIFKQIKLIEQESLKVQLQMRQILFYIFVCIGLHDSAQGFRVRHYLPDANNNTAKSIFEISPGQYMTGGFIVDKTSGENKLCLMGLNAQGQILWKKKYRNDLFEYLDNTFISRSYYKKNN